MNRRCSVINSRTIVLLAALTFAVTLAMTSVIDLKTQLRYENHGVINET